MEKSKLKIEIEIRSNWLVLTESFYCLSYTFKLDRGSIKSSTSNAKLLWAAQNFSLLWIWMLSECFLTYVERWRLTALDKLVTHKETDGHQHSLSSCWSQILHSCFARSTLNLGNTFSCVVLIITLFSKNCVLTECCSRDPWEGGVRGGFRRGGGVVVKQRVCN